MKKLMPLIPSIIFIMSCGENTNTNTDQPSTTAVSVLLDVTDPRAYWPSLTDIQSLFHCKETPNAECLFRLRIITDKKLAPVIKYRLADAQSLEKDNTEDDPQFRDKSIETFYRMIQKGMKDFYSSNDTTHSAANSECFRVIADELSTLSSIQHGERILVVVSDLLEKSDLADFYGKSSRDLRAIVERLDKTRLLPNDLSNVRIIFLFNPHNRKEDQAFSFSSEVYQQLLQSKHAIVKVQANL